MTYCNIMSLVQCISVVIRPGDWHLSVFLSHLRR